MSGFVLLHLVVPLAQTNVSQEVLKRCHYSLVSKLQVVAIKVVDYCAVVLETVDEAVEFGLAHDFGRIDHRGVVAEHLAVKNAVAEVGAASLFVQEVFQQSRVAHVTIRKAPIRGAALASVTAPMRLNELSLVQQVLNATTSCLAPLSLLAMRCGSSLTRVGIDLRDCVVVTSKLVAGSH